MSHHNDICPYCFKNKYSDECPHFDSQTNTYRADHERIDGGENEDRKAVGDSTQADTGETDKSKPEVMSDELDIQYVDVTDPEAIEAACRALDTIVAFETHSDLAMLPQQQRAQIKRIKRNSLSIIDDAIKSVLGYYEDKEDDEDD